MVAMPSGSPRRVEHHVLEVALVERIGWRRFVRRLGELVLEKDVTGGLRLEAEPAQGVRVARIGFEGAAHRERCVGALPALLVHDAERQVGVGGPVAGANGPPGILHRDRSLCLVEDPQVAVEVSQQAEWLLRGRSDTQLSRQLHDAIEDGVTIARAVPPKSAVDHLDGPSRIARRAAVTALKSIESK